MLRVFLFILFMLITYFMCLLFPAMIRTYCANLIFSNNLLSPIVVHLMNVQAMPVCIIVSQLWLF